MDRFTVLANSARAPLGASAGMDRRHFVNALALLLPLSFAAEADAQDPPPYHISVNVDLVVLHATVRDRKGRFASDLREGDLESTKMVSGNPSGYSVTKTSRLPSDWLSTTVQACAGSLRM